MGLSVWKSTLPNSSCYRLFACCTLLHGWTPCVWRFQWDSISVTAHYQMTLSTGCLSDTPRSASPTPCIWRFLLDSVSGTKHTNNGLFATGSLSASLALHLQHPVYGNILYGTQCLEQSTLPKGFCYKLFVCCALLQGWRPCIWRFQWDWVSGTEHTTKGLLVRALCLLRLAPRLNILCMTTLPMGLIVWSTAH
jgi:hypothetical protein